MHMLFPRIVRPATAGRNELLDVAQRLFARRGYDATTVDHVVAELGVTRAAFHLHFASKEDLVEALACRFAKATAAQAEAELQDPTMDAFSKLLAFMRTMSRGKGDNVAELRATLEPLLRTENVVLFERTHRAVTAVVRPILTRIIADGVEERTFDTADPESAAETIMHLMAAHRPLLTELYQSRDPREVRRLADRMHQKMQFLATVIDRILGIPEGSIALADRDTFEALACTPDPTPTAA
jgi:AcrR family transcriptional regulator